MSRITENVIIQPNVKLNSSRIVITSPETVTFGNVTYTKSNIYYKDNMGTLCNLFMIGNPQWCFGVNQVLDQKTGEVDGFQVCYNCTSKDTVQDPTREEKCLMDNFTTIRNSLVEFLSDEKNLEDVPASAKIFLERGESGIKPIFSYKSMPDPSNPKKKIPDTSAAPRIYAKLQKRKDKDTKQISITSRFFGPGNKQVNPVIYSELSPNASKDKDGNPRAVSGTITPVFKIESVYYGAHSSNPYGASLQVRISEANYSPWVANATLPRMLGANTTSVVTEYEDEEGCENEDDGEDVFDQEDTDTNPMEDLNSIEQTETATVEESRPAPTPKKKVVRRKVKKPE